MPHFSAIGLGIAAVLTFAPWAVFLAGICKLTDVFNSNQGAKWARQQQYMLEWFEIWFEFAIIVFAIVVAFGRFAKFSGYLHMWLGTNTALIIYSATIRLVTIAQINDGIDPGPYTSSNMDGLKCTAAGQISTAFMNFIIPIFLSIAAVSEVNDHKKDDDAKEAAAAV